MTSEVIKGRKLTTTEIVISKDETDQFEKIIYDIFKKDRNTQIYIDYLVYTYLEESKILERRKYVKRFHSCSATGAKPTDEHSYTIRDGKSMLFIEKDSLNYYRVTYFKKDTFEYEKNEREMNNIVVIYFVS